MLIGLWAVHHLVLQPWHINLRINNPNRRYPQISAQRPSINPGWILSLTYLIFIQHLTQRHKETIHSMSGGRSFAVCFLRTRLIPKAITVRDKPRPLDLSAEFIWMTRKPGLVVYGLYLVRLFCTHQLWISEVAYLFLGYIWVLNITWGHILILFVKTD